MRLPLLLVLVLASGCVTTRPAPLDTDAGRADLNARTAGRVATLYARGARHAVRGLHVGPDETTWVDRLSGRPQSAPTADVTAVSLRRGNSVWRSALVGAGIGTALGVIGELSEGRCGGFVCIPPGLIIGMAGSTGALAGVGVAASQSERFVPPRRAGVRLDTLR